MDLSQRALPRHTHHQPPPPLSNPSPSLQAHHSTYSPGSVASHPTLPLPGTHPPPSALTPASASTSPASVSHRLPSAPASNTSRHPHGDYLHDAEDPDASTTPVDGEEPAKKKQKRNKPTLSCHECVERKTKVRHFMRFAFSNHVVLISFHLIYPLGPMRSEPTRCYLNNTAAHKLRTLFLACAFGF